MKKKKDLTLFVFHSSKLTKFVSGWFPKLSDVLCSKSAYFSTSGLFVKRNVPLRIQHPFHLTTLLFRAAFHADSLFFDYSY